jgi:sugar lactone lactonase YvrE
VTGALRIGGSGQGRLGTRHARVAIALAIATLAGGPASAGAATAPPDSHRPGASLAAALSARANPAPGAARATVAAAELSADRMIWTRFGGVVDGPADQASLMNANGMVGGGGGDLYLSELGSNVIRRFDASRGRLDTIAGDGTMGFAGDGGPYANARFLWPNSLARDARGVIYLSDFGNQRVRVLNPTRRAVTVATVRIDPGEIETIAGNGDLTPFLDRPPDRVPALETSMTFPRGVAVDGAGNVFYCDIDSEMVRVIWNSGPDAGLVETYAGSGWPDPPDDIEYPRATPDGIPARDMILASPSAVTVGPDGDLYLAEWAFNPTLGRDSAVIWRIDHDDRTAHRVAGDPTTDDPGDGGPALDARLPTNVQSIVFDADANLFLSGETVVRRIDATTGVITTVAGKDEGGIPTFSAADEGRPAVDATITGAAALVWTAGELTFIDREGGAVRRIDRRGILRGVIRARSGIKLPFTAAIDARDRLFISEWAHGRIRRLDPDGSLATAVNLLDIAGSDGSGLALLARSGAINGVAFDEHGDLYLSDVSSSRVLQVRALPGPGGRLIRPLSPIREIARFAPPFDALIDQIAAHGGTVYAGEAISSALLEIDVATGATSTLAGGDGALASISGLALDVAHGRIFVADPLARQVVAVDLASGAISPVAELPYPFGFPNLHMVLADGLLFVANDFSGAQVYVIDTDAPTPVAELYAGMRQDFDAGVSGDGGPAREAGLAIPEGIVVDSAGKLQIAERDSGRVRQVGTSDILPGAFPNVIHASSGARIDVAIQGNPSFDASRLIASNVTVGGVATDGARLRDVNGDGRRDLVVRVRQNALAAGIGADAREAAIEGTLRGGGTLRDADWVTLAP